MTIKLEITGLTVYERDSLLKQLKLIKDKVYNDLKVDYSLLTHSPNWINVEQEIETTEKAFFLMECFQRLHIKHENDLYYEIYEDVDLKATVEYTKKWEELSSI